jgi:hypothetical protein
VGHPWRGEAKLNSANGEWQTFQATWIGPSILDGYVIADEYRMGLSGELLVLGVNMRANDAAKQTWNMKWRAGWKMDGPRTGRTGWSRV